jgi:hypothetical protein
MGKVEPRDVETSAYELPKGLLIAGGRPQGADDLRATRVRR